jgi:hypothetical protein
VHSAAAGAAVLGATFAAGFFWGAGVIEWRA